MRSVRRFGCICMTVFVAISITACGMPGSGDRTGITSDKTAEETPETSVTFWIPMK